MDSCQRFKEMVSDYIEGGLDHQDQSRMEQHLRECLGCERSVKRVKNLIHDLRTLPKRTVSPDFETILRARISLESSLERRRRERWFAWGQFRIPAYGFAAIAIILIVLAAMAIRQPTQTVAIQGSRNNEWYQGGVEKIDPATNQRYIFIYEMQPVPQFNPIAPSEPNRTANQAFSDSTQSVKSDLLWYEAAEVIKTKVY